MQSRTLQAMKRCTFVALALSAAATSAAPGTVAECRSAHPDDHPGYVRCLETALAERDARAESSPERPPATREDRAADAPANSSPPAPDEAARAAFGAEQLPPAEEELLVTIVSARYDARGLGTFRMADGQVWRETTKAPERRRLRSGQEYTGRIVRGKVGGYRLHVDGVRWMKTVERVE